MNKILLTVIAGLMWLASVSQTVSEPYRLFPKANFRPPQDTAINPVFIGEIRYKASDSKFYKSISLTGQKWADLLSISGSGIIDLNGLTASNQTLDTSSSGNDIKWVSAAGKHTLYLPDATDSYRGLVKVGLQFFGGTKYFTGGLVTYGGSLYGTDVYFTHSQTTNSILFGVENATAYLMYSMGTRNIEFGSNTTGRVRYRASGNHVFGDVVDDGSSKLQVDGLIKSFSTTGTGDAPAYWNSSGQLIRGPVAPQLKIRVVDDADFTVAVDDGTVLIKNNTTTRTATVPAASSHTNRTIRIVNTGTVSLTSSVSLRVSPSTTTTSIGTNTTIEIQSDGTDWWIIGIYNR
jgi:hypothetical protein